jgi:hypothetical protein
MLTALLIVLSIIYQVVAASVTVLSMMCPSVVYVNNHFLPVLNMKYHQ